MVDRVAGIVVSVVQHTITMPRVKHLTTKKPVIETYDSHDLTTTDIAKITGYHRVVS